MARLARIPLLAKMAVRYARRHRGQTTRAVLGLVVVALVLTTGLGLGDSVGQSLETSVRAQYGPIDIVVRAPGPFNQSVADGLPAMETLRAYGLTGGATFLALGAVSNPEKNRAEAFAHIRGVSAQEPSALGPLPGGAAEPRPGEVVLSRSLADRLEADVGDSLILRAPLPGASPEVIVRTTNMSGVASGPGDLSSTTFAVEAGAVGLLAIVRFDDDANLVTVTATARPPIGAAHTNSSTSSPIPIAIEGALAQGTWTFTVTATVPIQFTATIAVFHPPEFLALGFGTLNASVSAIVPDVGRAAASFRPVALVPLSDLQDAMGLRNQATHGYYHTEADAHETVAAIQRTLNNELYQVLAIQEDTVARVQSGSQNITGFLLVMSGFTLVASMLLAYALFSALVEERRIELGIARALGLTRLEVATGMVLEGLLYAFVAAVVGVLLGILLLLGILTGINRLSSTEGGPTFGLHLEPSTLPLAFAGGILLPLVTIAVGTVRFARLDPARAIRGAPDDLRVRRRAGLVGGAILLGLGLLLALDPFARLIGVGLATSGAGILLWILGPRRLGLAIALAGAIYTGWTLYAFDEFPADAGELDPLLTMARGLVLSLMLATLVVVSPAPYRFLGKVLAKARALERPVYMAFRYLSARRKAAGLTAAMIAVVAVVVTVMGTLAALFSNSIPTDEGGYEVIGETPLPRSGFPGPLPQEAVDAIDRVDFVPTHRELRSPNVTMNGKRMGEDWMWRDYAGIDAGFAAANRFEIVQRSDRYATDLAAWEAVARGEAVLAPGWFFGPDELEKGATLVIDTALDDPVSYHVAGGIVGERRGALFISKERIGEMGFPRGAAVYVRVKEGADPDALAHLLTDEYGTEGFAFESVPQEAQRAAAIIQATILVFESFLALGVFVGIAATGFLASRAVHERIRDIGTLRALGYEAPDVRRAFILESTLVCALGLLVGIGVGLLVAHSIWWRGIQEGGIEFVLPWAIILGFAATVLVLAALAARGPARRAARLDPAASLRHIE